MTDWTSAAQHQNAYISRCAPPLQNLASTYACDAMEPRTEPRQRLSDVCLPDYIQIIKGMSHPQAL